MDGPTMSTGSLLVACTSLGMGLLILYITIFTLTIPHWSLPYLRLAFAPAAMMLFWNFGYGPYSGPTRNSSPALATVGLYGIMRILEHSVITFWDASPPHWVMRTQSVDGSRVVVSMPSTFRARCVYAMDLLTSMRGLSWFADLEWNWVPRSLPSQPQIPRMEFIRYNIGSFVVQYLTFDLCDAILQSHPWDAKSLYPMTGLPIFEQVIFSTCICTGIILSMTLTYTVVSCVFVLCGSSPIVWPPLFDSPFLSKSLKEFWSRRWHFTFRRVFERLSLPFMQISGVNKRANTRLVNVLRSFLTFVLSTLLHLIIIHRLTSLEIHRTGRTDSPQFFDGSILGFFLFQPLGLVVESTLGAPFGRWMFPASRDDWMQESRSHSMNGTPYNGNAKVSVKSTESIKRAIVINPPERWERDTLTRLYVWVFIIWTGRWWSDAWVRAGLLDKRMKAVPISPLRGLRDGQWVM